MVKITKENFDEHIRSVSVTFLESGETVELRNDDSRCSFIRKDQADSNERWYRFKLEEVDVQLRLDWSDLDRNGHPTLDADFYTKGGDGKKSVRLPLKGERGESHHTAVLDGDGPRTYIWEHMHHKIGFTVSVSYNWDLEFGVGIASTFDLHVPKRDG